eukprot:gene9364-1575_t
MRQLYFWLIFTFLVFIINSFYMYQILNLRKNREDIQKGFSLQTTNKCSPYHYKMENDECLYTPKTFETWRNMPQICLYMSTECKGRQMSWTDLLVLDLILTTEKKIKNFIEFGTLGGEVSLYLGMVSKMRNGQFITLDKMDRRTENIQKSWFENMEFIKEEHLYDNLTISKNELMKNEKGISKLFLDENTMVLFDGFKCAEIEAYLKYFKGSIFLTKDWDPLDYDCVAKYLDDYDFSEIFENLVDSVGSKLKAWKRINSPKE